MTIDTMIAEARWIRRPSWRSIMRASWLVLRRWHLTRRTRRSLIDMTDEQLLDIGVTRSEARREIGKSYYWD